MKVWAILYNDDDNGWILCGSRTGSGADYVFFEEADFEEDVGRFVKESSCYRKIEVEL